MLHYKASELVRRAMILANIENSSFISAEENRQVINDAYWALYQIMIDKGDTYFVVTLDDIRFENGVFKLPDDFYQLSLVRDDYGNDVPRKQKNSLKTTKCYDVRKRVVIIDEEEVEATCLINYNNANIKMIEYFPVPITLEPSGDDDELYINLPSNAFYQCMLYNMAIYYKVRMNEDATDIKELYNDALATFTDTLQVDTNEYLQMRDVYSRRPSLGL